MLIFASVLWATDALPTQVTALMIPFIAELLSLFPGSWGENAKRLIVSTISNTPYLAMGGYTIALGMKYTGLDIRIGNFLLSFKVARNPLIFLLILVSLSYILTLVISNISSTVIVLSLLLPVLRDVPFGGGFSRMSLLAVAMAGNIAGMASPLASPQSMVGLEAIQEALGEKSTINFGKWYRKRENKYIFIYI